MENIPLKKTQFSDLEPINGEQKEFAFIVHTVETAIIHQRAVDGFVDATAMCKATGKNFSDYMRLVSTGEFLNELSIVTGIPITGLVVSRQGGVSALQGTWVHPDVSVNLGQWCSPKFAVAVSQWIREWSIGKSKPKELPYHIQRYIANRSAIPSTHFSMLNELIFALIAPLEMAGYTLPDDMIPDISTGRMFCKWLRDVKGIDTDSLPTYEHYFGDGRVVRPKLYPNSVLADFRDHFHSVWLPEKAAGYFSERDQKALQYLPKLLPGTDAFS